MTRPPTTQLETASPEETLALGERLAHAARPGDCIALIGDLGAGKTVLVKGIARGLRLDPADVTSPTFVLISPHAGDLTLYHFDAYRLNQSAELLAVGAEEIFYGDGLSVIEWADRVTDILPRDRLEIAVTPAGKNQRRFRLLATGPRGRRLARAVAVPPPAPGASTPP